MIAAGSAAADWLARFDTALGRGDVQNAANLFAPDGYWRDLLAFTWNIHTCEGCDAIAAMLAATLARTAPSRWQACGEAREAGGIVEVPIGFETAVGRGEGVLRLRDGAAWTLLTAMRELKGHEEKRGPTRPLGVQHGAIKGRGSWLERRTAEAAVLGREVQPYCLVIGGGQGGIMLAARLRRLGVPALIVEKNARPGNSWRNRYASLVLHDPVWYDHLPYLPFPDDWPVFTPKDKMGDWLEAYVRIMELDYWPASDVTAAQYDAKTATWTVTVNRDGEAWTLRPCQLVFATGAYGPPNVPRFSGESDFAGEILHSSAYRGGAPFRGKSCVVIGANSSAHDICADLWENGAQVTMVQRSPTTVVRSETLMELAFGPLYSEAALQAGITTDIADLLVAAMPFGLIAAQQRPLYAAIARRDAALYDGLRRAGFLLDWGEDESGLMMKALRTGSGYYIDVGASDLIVRGEIALRSGVEIAGILPRAVRLADGSELPAELIVLATGYRSMHETVARIVSPEVAAAVGPCWGLGSGVRGDPGPWQGELRNMWKPTAQPALWFQGGNLALSRHYSEFLALQIKARMEGIATPVYGGPAAG